MKKTNFNGFKLTLLLTSFYFVILCLTNLLGLFILQHLIMDGFITYSNSHIAPMAIFSLFSLIIGTLTAFFIHKKTLRPLENLLNSINKVAHGEFNAKVSLKSAGYFFNISESFNKMIDYINSTEIFKTNFIDDFSHEFKTPINAIQGFANTLKSHHLSEQEREEFLDIIINETQRLTTLSDNILLLSKIDNQVILTDTGFFNLSEQLREVIIMLYPKMDAKNISIHLPEQDYFINGNAQLLKQVWINLLDNALKFSPPDKPINITIMPQDDALHLSFSNYGTPIADDQAALIFDKFYQVDTSRCTKGNGLGLTITKKIILLHKGDIYLSSHVSDKICFELFLPCSMP